MRAVKHLCSLGDSGDLASGNLHQYPRKVPLSSGMLVKLGLLNPQDKVRHFDLLVICGSFRRRVTFWRAGECFSPGLSNGQVLQQRHDERTLQAMPRTLDLALVPVFNEFEQSMRHRNIQSGGR